MTKNVKNPETPSIKDKVRGCLIGSAVGDALGMAVEGMTRSDIQSQFGIITGYLDSCSRYSNGLTKGGWTDDTRLTLANAQGIIRTIDGARSFDLQKLCDNILDEHFQALEDHTKRGFGRTTRESLQDRKDGKDPFDGRHPVRPGNGCAMKSAILGVVLGHLNLYGFYGESSDADIISSVSLLTHCDARSLSAAYAQAYAAYWFLHGWDFREKECFNLLLDATTAYENNLSRSFPVVKDGTPRVSEIIQRIPSMLTASDELIADTFKTGSAAFESFPVSLAYALKYSDDFQNAVLAGANAGGDTDTIAAMSGALVGIRLGFSAIPQEWVLELEDKDEIISVVDKLYGATSFFAVQNGTVRY